MAEAPMVVPNQQTREGNEQHEEDEKGGGAQKVDDGAQHLVELWQG